MRIKYDPTKKKPVTTTHWHLELQGSGVPDLIGRVEATVAGMVDEWQIKSCEKYTDDGKLHIYFVLGAKSTNEFTREFMHQLKQHDLVS